MSEVAKSCANKVAVGLMYRTPRHMFLYSQLAFVRFFPFGDEVLCNKMDQWGKKDMPKLRITYRHCAYTSGNLHPM